jgi:hypothetical protein
MMHGHEKSDPEIVAIRTNAGGTRREKPANNAAPTAAELVERTLRSGTLACANRTLGRAGTKGNAGQQSTLRAHNWLRVFPAPGFGRKPPQWAGFVLDAGFQ